MGKLYLPVPLCFLIQQKVDEISWFCVCSCKWPAALVDKSFLFMRKNKLNWLYVTSGNCNQFGPATGQFILVCIECDAWFCCTSLIPSLCFIPSLRDTGDPKKDKMQPDLSLAAIHLVLSYQESLKSVNSSVNQLKLLTLEYILCQTAQCSLALQIWCIIESRIHCKSLSYCLVKSMLASLSWCLNVEMPCVLSCIQQSKSCNIFKGHLLSISFKLTNVSEVDRYIIDVLNSYAEHHNKTKNYFHSKWTRGSLGLQLHSEVLGIVFFLQV